MSFAHMKSMINAVGGTVRGSKIHDGKLLMQNQLMTDPSYRENFFLWKYGVSKEDYKHIDIKLFNEKYSAVEGYTVNFNCLTDDRPLIGDILYDAETELYWIVYQSYNRDKILADGLLKRLNIWLKWQDKDGKIHEYPAYDTNTTQYNSGVSGSEEIQLGSAQHVLLLTADDNTIQIDHGQRAFIDRNTINPTVYVVTQNDTTTLQYETGIVKLTFSEDELKPDVDRIDLWICDYREVKPKQDIEISYSGSPTVRIGMSKVFTASDNTAVFSTELDEELSSVITLSNMGDGRCTISALIAQRAVGKSFVLTATGSNGATGTLEVVVVGGVD